MYLAMVGYGKSSGDYVRTQGTQHMLWNQCSSSPKLIVEALTPNVTIFGGGIFGRLLGLDEVMITGPPG